MVQKTVLLTINHVPHGSVFCAEGLRTAVGVISTMDEHNAILYERGGSRRKDRHNPGHRDLQDQKHLERVTPVPAQTTTA